MGKTLAELRATITDAELALWAAFNQIEPFDGAREDHRAYSITALLANIHRGKGQPPYKLADFLPRWESSHKPPAPEQHWMQSKCILRSITTAHNASIGLDPDGGRAGE